MSDTAKLGLLAAAGVGAWWLLSGSSTASPGDDCTKGVCTNVQGSLTGLSVVGKLADDAYTGAQTVNIADPDTGQHYVANPDGTPLVDPTGKPDLAPVGTPVGTTVSVLTGDQAATAQSLLNSINVSVHGQSLLDPPLTSGGSLVLDSVPQTAFGVSIWDDVYDPRLAGELFNQQVTECKQSIGKVGFWANLTSDKTDKCGGYSVDVVTQLTEDYYKALWTGIVTGHPLACKGACPDVSGAPLSAAIVARLSRPDGSVYYTQTDPGGCATLASKGSGSCFFFSGATESNILLTPYTDQTTQDYTNYVNEIPLVASTKSNTTIPVLDDETQGGGITSALLWNAIDNCKGDTACFNKVFADNIVYEPVQDFRSYLSWADPGFAAKVVSVPRSQFGVGQTKVYDPSRNQRLADGYVKIRTPANVISNDPDLNLQAGEEFGAKRTTLLYSKQYMTGGSSFVGSIGGVPWSTQAKVGTAAGRVCTASDEPGCVPVAAQSYGAMYTENWYSGHVFPT